VWGGPVVRPHTGHTRLDPLSVVRPEEDQP
jgi:hypothetical protein